MKRELAPTPARRRRKRPVDRRGVALVLVLGAITMLTVFLTELQEQTSSELSAAIAERDALKAEYYARSAVNLSRLLIATEPSVSRTVGPVLSMLSGGKMKPGEIQIPLWEFTDMVLGPFNDASGNASFASMIGADPTASKALGIPGGGRFEVSIVDEDAKINLNLAALNKPEQHARLAEQLLGLIGPQQYNPMFEGRDPDNQFSDRQLICGAMIDWADSDVVGNEQQYPCDPRNQNAQSTAPEDNYYQVISLPYRRKNAAYDSLEELRLVRGVGDDFWSTFVDPDPADPKKRIMTVWGQNKINLNSANAQTLLALVCAAAKVESNPCNDVEQAASFLMAVNLIKSFTMNMPILSPSVFVDMMQGGGQFGPLLAGPPFNLKPVSFVNAKDFKQSLTTKSKIFSIYADGVVPGAKRTTRVRIHTVVDFRNAADLATSVPGILGAGQPGAAGASGGTPPSSANSANNALPSAATPDIIAATLNSNPAGRVIYWRVE